MGGYLEDYGVADERRSKVIRWIVILGVLAGILALSGYFLLRTYPAKHQVGVFLRHLEQHDYRAAYRDWGCMQDCKDYTYESFLQDWGPKGGYSGASIKRTRYCETGVILTLSGPSRDDVALWYERRTGALGFAPWPICAPHIPAPTGPTPSP
jgi:hypothetical protein